MKATFLALSLLSFGYVTGTAASATAQEASESSPAGYVGRVDPEAFPYRPRSHHPGVTVDPASVRLITPGVDKFSIYPLLGPPHFGEVIARRWNYELLFPTSPGSAERVQCRMEIRFERPSGQYHVRVSEVVWQEQSCADRVAQAN